MRIEFDTNSEREVAAVAALIDVLADRQPRVTGRVAGYRVSDENGATRVEVIADPAEAFAGGASAEQAFGGTAARPLATPPIGAETDTTGLSVPASMQDNGGGNSGSGQNATTGASPSSPARTGVDVDKDGLPHDGRIHSSPPKKNADGSWRQKRGVDPALVTSVSAELRQIMAVPVPSAAPSGGLEAAAPTPPAPPAAPVVPPTPPAPPAPAATGDGITDPAPTAPVAADAAAAVSAPPAPPAPASLTFADLMRKITGLQSAGNLTVEGTQQIAQSLGITGVRDLMQRPDLIPSFDALLPAAA